MTYRERREAKAERLTEWAEKREQRASAARASSDAISSMIPMGQPILVGHHSEKRHRRDVARIQNGMRSSIEHGRTAEEMTSRAANIEAANERAIYSDDPDAIEKLEERIVELEAERERRKALNAAYRKEHAAELKAMTAYERGQSVPFPSYSITNLSGNIGRQKKRLEQLKRQGSSPPPDRIISARYSGTCATCSAPIERGQAIRYSRTDGARCVECPEEA